MLPTNINLFLFLFKNLRFKKMSAETLIIDEITEEIKSLSKDDLEELLQYIGNRYHTQNQGFSDIFYSKHWNEKSSKKTYITKPEDTWLLSAFFDVKIDFDLLNDSIIENLFENAHFNFYLNEDEKFLFICTSEILEHDFGKLHPISGIDALKNFGLQKLEVAKEKGYVKV